MKYIVKIEGGEYLCPCTVVVNVFVLDIALKTIHMHPCKFSCRDPLIQAIQ